MPFTKATPKAVLHLTASPKVTLEDLKLVLERAVGIGGCLTCGLLGIDLHFHGGDPILEKLHVPNIGGVSIELPGQRFG